MSTRSPIKSANADVVAILAALCLALSAIELVIPKPLPFLRLGIANLPLIVACSLLGPRDYAALAFAKILGMGIISGTLFSYVFLFSLAGSSAAAVVMYLSRRVFGRRIGHVGISVLGATASNSIQIALAGVFMFGASARLIAPPFLAVGTVTGILLGVMAERFEEKSLWFARTRKRLPDA